MRKLVVAAATAALAIVPAAGAVPARAASGPAAQGQFGRLFREDWGGPLHTDASTSSDGRDANGCKTVQDPTRGAVQECLPAGATVAMLADGRILYWNALEGTENVKVNTVAEFGAQAAPDQTRVLSLSPGATSWAQPTGASAPPPANPEPQYGVESDPYYPNAVSLFCSDQVQLADGRIFDVGGTDYYLQPGVDLGGGTAVGVTELEGAKNARIFDPTTSSWISAAAMQYGRWYPGAVTEADGKVFVASGVTKLIKPVYPDRPADSGTNVEQTETYDPQSNSFSQNGDSGKRSLPLFPRLHLLPNGHVFYDAAGQDFNPSGQSYDEALWNIAGSYDPSTKTWSDLGIPGIGTTAPGFRGSTFSASLQMKAPYDTVSYLDAGGVLGTTPGSWVSTDESQIHQVKVGADGSETLSVFETGSLNNRRWYSSAVPLPDGRVFAVSGGDVDEVVTPGFESPVKQAELFTPTAWDAAGNPTNGRWDPAGTETNPRTYHNTAVLLPDGRVLVGGNAPIPRGYSMVGENPDLPGRPASNNHHDASFQIWTPPNLIGHDADRPRFINFTDPKVQRGDQNLVVTTDDAPSIDSVVLIRNQALTHLVDADNRSVALPIESRSGNSVHLSVTGNSAVLPSGPYLMFLNKKLADGTIVPSVASQVFVVGQGEQVPAWARTTSAFVTPPALVGQSAASVHPAVTPTAAIPAAGAPSAPARSAATAGGAIPAVLEGERASTSRPAAAGDAAWLVALAVAGLGITGGATVRWRRRPTMTG